MRIINQKVLKQTIEKTIVRDIAEGRVGGAAVAVMQDGETIYQQCFDDEKLNIHVTEHTMFRLASMTKPITVIAVLLLADQGMIDLDTEISQFIPEFQEMYLGEIVGNELRNKCLSNRQITIRHLLSHCSGVGSGPVGEYVGNKLPGAERTSLKKVVEHYAKNPLDFEPFTKYAYSAIHGYDILARIVEIVSGMRYDAFLKKEIFEPLDMQDTTFSPSDEQWERMIPMHNYVEGKGKIEPVSKKCVFGSIPTTCCCGGAGLASTLNDYKKFTNMLLKKGDVNGRQLLDERWITQMATPQLPKTIMSGPIIWGLGVRVVVSSSYVDLPIGAYGWSGAYGAHFWIDPSNRIVGIYLKNSMYDGGSGAKTARQFERDVNAALNAC